LREARVKFRLQEGEEEVEQVDAEAVGDDVPALRDDDSEEKSKQNCAGADPTIAHIGCGFVEVGLVLPHKTVCVQTDGIEGSGLRLWSVHGGW